MHNKLDARILDKIIKNTMSSIEKGKAQIYDIYEAARAEMENISRDVERVKQETIDIIFTVDELEAKERRARLHLMEVSRSFRVFSEEDIQAAYEEAKTLQVQLAVARTQERHLRRQRDELEIRLRVLKDTVEKAENLVSQVGAVLGYLGNQMDGVVVAVDSLQQSRNFGSRIIKAQEAERNRVAREIHDGPAQAMANIVLRVEVCERLVDVDVERTKGELQNLREQARLCLKDIRKIIFNLRPMTLDDLGLVPTVRRFLEAMQERTGIVHDVRIIGEEKRLDSSVEQSLFRIIQEALRNVEKHSNATAVEVVMEFHRTMLTAIVSDNGKGLPAEQSEEEMAGFGWLDMRERTQLLKGEMEVKMAVNGGVRITVRIPL